MTGRRQAGAAPQHHLVAHELAVVLPDGAFGNPVTRISAIGAPGPLPDVAEHFGLLSPFALAGAGAPRVQLAAVGEATSRRVVGGSGGGVLPLLLGREARARPARVGVGLVVADVGDDLVGVDGASAGQRVDQPVPVAGFPLLALLPVERRPPALAL